MVFLLACGGLLTHDLKVQPRDRAILLDVVDVVTQYPSLKVDPALGTYSKRRLTNGGIENTYRYKTPDGQQPTLLVETHVLVAKDASAASLDYSAMKVSLSVGTAASRTVSAEDRPDALAWGDDHQCIAMVAAGNERGISCIARKGQSILLVLVAGALDTRPLSHDHGMDALLAERLPAIEAYQR